MTHYQETRAFFAQGLLWVNVVEARGPQLVGLDPRTGEKRRHLGGAGGAHCAPPVATRKYFIAPECNFADFETGERAVARMVKGACRLPFVPAHGLLYTFPVQCECYPMLRGYMALAADPLAVEAAVGAMLQSVRPGGSVLLHVLNLWRLPDGPAQWQKCVRLPLGGADSLIIKGIHRAGARGFVNVLITRLSESQPLLHSECVPFLGLEAADLTRMAMAGGAAAVEVFGDYQRSAYDRGTSQDLLALAIKAT